MTASVSAEMLARLSLLGVFDGTIFNMCRISVVPVRFLYPLEL